MPSTLNSSLYASSAPCRTIHDVLLFTALASVSMMPSDDTDGILRPFTIAASPMAAPRRAASDLSAVSMCSSILLYVLALLLRFWRVMRCCSESHTANCTSALGVEMVAISVAITDSMRLFICSSLSPWICSTRHAVKITLPWRTQSDSAVASCATLPSAASSFSKHTCAYAAPCAVNKQRPHSRFCVYTLCTGSCSPNFNRKSKMSIT